MSLGTERLVVDLLDPDFYRDGERMHAAFTWMRANEPVYRDRRNGLWGITRNDDVRDVERRSTVFASGQGYRAVWSSEEINMIAQDDPRHRQQRSQLRFEGFRRISQHARPALTRDSFLHEHGSPLCERIAQQEDGGNVLMIDKGLDADFIAKLALDFAVGTAALLERYNPTRACLLRLVDPLARPLVQEPLHVHLVAHLVFLPGECLGATPGRGRHPLSWS